MYLIIFHFIQLIICIWKSAMDPKGPGLYKLAKGKLLSNFTTADPTLQQVTYGENTILHVAAHFGKTEFAEEILNLDRSLLCKLNKKGETPLHIAARLGYTNMASLLIKKEDVEQGMKLLAIENLAKDTALHVAFRNGHLEIVKLLIEKDPTLGLITNKAQESPLFVAVDWEFYNIALEILKLQEFSVEGRTKRNALHAAVIRTHKCKSFDFTLIS